MLSVLIDLVALLPPPLSREQVKKTSRLVTLEEGWPQSGLGSEIVSIVSECERAHPLHLPPFACCVLTVACVLLLLTVCVALLCSLRAAEAFDYLDAPPARITGADVPMPYVSVLEKGALPQLDDVVRVVERTVSRPFKK